MKQFNYERVKTPKRAMHDLSHEKKLTMNMADLVPIFLQEVIPGDKFTVNTELLIRMQPMIAPTMHRINAYVHYFYVPDYIIYDDYEDFFTGGKDGKQTPNMPKLTGQHQDFYNLITDLDGGTFRGGAQTLLDYFGIPTQMYTQESDIAPSINLLPFRAYQKIWNDYYRDPTLQNEYEFSTDSSDIDVATQVDEAVKMCTLRKRCWEKDYFTSALPWAQRGDQVLLPLTGNAPVVGSFASQAFMLNSPHSRIDNADLRTSADGHIMARTATPTDYDIKQQIQSGSDIHADLSSASSTTINELRRSFAIQRFLEKNARGGWRYVEQLLSRFGVKGDDLRLKRPKYLGGGKLPIRIGEVLQTSQTDNTPQANMAGHGVTGGDVMGFNGYFKEHGYIIGILSVIPRTSYMEGLPKMFSRTNKYDFFTPEFAHIGEEPILNQELYLQQSTANNGATFGYARRYASYCYAFDSVHGQMKNTMKYWTLAREFYPNIPSLSEEFVVCDPATRIFAVTNVGNYGELIVQLYNKTLALRPVPKYGEPI